MNQLTAEDINKTRRAIMDSKAGREALEELIDLADLNEQSDAFRRGFYRQMLKHAKSVLPEAPEPQADKRPVMTEDEAKRFEDQTIGFGMYATHTWREVSNSYLTWLHEQEIQLGAYLRSNRGQARQSPLWVPGEE
jgi:hypothetical protein